MPALGLFTATQRQAGRAQAGQERGVARLRLGDQAFGPDIGRELGTRAGRRVSRGALYMTFDRLEDKGLIRWRTVPGTEARDGLPRRLYTVTAPGVAALRAARDVVKSLWYGLDARLKKEPGT